MHSLELKTPPPVIAVVIFGMMWGGSSLAPLLEMPMHLRFLATILVALAGLIFSITGVASFRRAQTTVNPRKPEMTSVLVTTGIFNATRNPMYVGLFLALIACAIYLSSAWALLGPLAFFFYINRFQIEPEERILLERFGAEYSFYKAKVRRWL